MTDYKAEGNAFLKQQQYDKAIESYTQGLTADPKNQSLLSNRALAYIKSGNPQKGLEDAEAVIGVNAEWDRGYLRKAQAQIAMGDFLPALEAITKGTKINPENKQLNDLKMYVIRTLQTQFTQSQPQQQPQQQQSTTTAQAEQPKTQTKPKEEPKKQQQQQQQQAQANTAGATRMKQMQAMIEIMREFGNTEVLLAKIKAHPKGRHFADDLSFIEMLNDIRESPQKLQEYLQKDKRLLPIITDVLGIDLGIPNEEEQLREQERIARAEEQERERRRKRIRAEKEAAKKKKLAEEQEKNKLPQFQEKLKGNEAYKKRDFENAMKHYEAAIQIDPKNVIFYLNKASVLIETGEYEKAIQVCDKAMEIAIEKGESGEIKAKIYAKKGNCYFRKGDYEAALVEYDESAIQKAIPAVRLQIKKTKAAIEEQKALAYRDPAKAEEAKAQGSAYFKKQQFPEAKKCYDEAIKRDPENHIHYSNRAMVYMKLGAYSYAIKDANQCLEIEPTFVKAYRTKGKCHVFLKEYAKAMKAYDEGLAQAPSDPQLRSLKKQLIQRINLESQALDGDHQEKVKEAMKDPKVAAILNDPKMQNVLQQLSNPDLAQQFMRDPEIAPKIATLMKAGIIQTA